MKVTKPTVGVKYRGLLFAGLLAVALAALFARSFLPDYVHFNNDGPLGAQSAAWLQFPQSASGFWDDLNSIGSNLGVFAPDISIIVRWLIGPVGLSKFFTPLCLWILGMGAWFFFRQLRLAPLAAVLGAVAAMLNSTFFADACWGVATHEVALGMIFFALGLVVSNTAKTPPLIRWTRLALAGLCVGVNVIEAADIGAIYSMFFAAFVFYKTLADDEETVVKKNIYGAGRVAVVAACAGLIAIQTLMGFLGTQIQGIAGTGQDAETKAQHWDWATQWSEPKIETLSLVVAGLFGYKMDTPAYMMSSFQDAYRGGAYWGGVGRDPANDRFFDSGGQGSPPNPTWMRQTGGSNYCGILVVLLATWAIAQSFRRQNSPLTSAQKKHVWFWTAVIVISLPLAWGRFAPFYQLLYQLPYFSTIRNPSKFLIFLSWAMVILFGYGVHALSRQYFEITGVRSSGLTTQLKNWWAKAGSFDRRWIYINLEVFGAGVLGWFIYSKKKSAVVQYLQARGFPDEDVASQIITFSLSQVGWFLVLLAIAIILVTLIIAGYFSGSRAKIGGWLLGTFLIFDLVRADLPYIIHLDYKQKYEVGALNPIEEFLRDKPYEHRVAKLLPSPLSTPSQFELFDQLYNIEWTQHHFPYYSIQSLDIIQMSRMPEDLLAYMNALRIGIKPNADGGYMLDETTFPKLTRLWELTNTRYLLGPAGFINIFNTQFDPGKNRFQIAQRFEVVPKPGISQPTKLEELTAIPKEDGNYALIEFTGALPRAKLYSNWQVNTNDEANLKTLADLNFDPAKTVLISTREINLSASATNENSGTVEFKSYAPKHIVFAANVTMPSILLLNDKYDSHWRVTVDGKPAELLRCNFIMRGVYLPPGAHTVEFYFSLPNGPLYVTLAGIVAGFILCSLLFFWTRRQPAV
jgi:hypothetical protein